MSEKLLVFIPCYNCGQQITRVLRQFDDATSGLFSEILVLDNGSKDNTVTAATEASKELRHARVTIGRNHANYNLGGSHKVAFRYAAENGFTHVVVLHGDDQGDIHDLVTLLKAGRHRNSDACLGARFMLGSRLLGYSKFRIFGNHVFNAIFTIGTGRSVKDLGSGLNIFSKRVIESQQIFNYADDLRFNIYLLLGMFRSNLKTDYFPISWREVDQVSNVKMTSQAFDTLKLLWKATIDRNNFWLLDHRVVKHASYEFDAVYKSSLNASVPV